MKWLNFGCGTSLEDIVKDLLRIDLDNDEAFVVTHATAKDGNVSVGFGEKE